MTHKPSLRKLSPAGSSERLYAVMDPLEPNRIIGRVRSYVATNTSWGSSRHVDRGWVAALANGIEVPENTLHDTRHEAVTAIIRAVYP